MLTGFGMLRGDGQDIGRVEYKITVHQRNNVRSADGVIWGGPDLLVASIECSTFTLTREDNNYEMRVILRSTTGDGMAQIAVDGSPGPT